MCRMLVRVVDKVGETPAQTARLTKRGDVIDVLPDGWVFSVLERTNPDWMIVDLPGQTSEAFQFLKAREPGSLRTNPMLRKRARFFDFADLPANIRNRFDGGTRPVESVTLTLAQVNAINKLKPAIAT